VRKQVWRIIDGWTSRGRKEKSAAVLRWSDIEDPQAFIRRRGGRQFTADLGLPIRRAPLEAPMARLKVMVVDDDPVALEIACAILESQGHEVLARETALGTAVAVLRECPDVVLLDIRMPGISGPELLKVLRSQDRARGAQPTAFIFYSGLERDELDRLVEETGALGAVEKAAAPGQLASILEALLAQVRPRESDTAAR
jgi:CheY-like chemotaxis protein